VRDFTRREGHSLVSADPGVSAVERDSVERHTVKRDDKCASVVAEGGTVR
jgi:hypothetical protein